MKILIIQTAFIGDVILATPLIQELKRLYPHASIDVLIRKGNENLLQHHPDINHLLIWNKGEKKYRHLFQISKQVRKNSYDLLINLQRFAASGFIAWRSKAKSKIGFDKNPFSFTYHKKIKHEIGNGKHEVERNLELIAHLGANSFVRPQLFPSNADFKKVAELKKHSYCCVAPTSVWFTKQLPPAKWISLITKIAERHRVFILGGPDDRSACDEIYKAIPTKNVENLAGQLTLLESAALMKDAVMNYVNDSAPLHLCSAMNANCTAFFCSTVPEFGFGPLSDHSKIIETTLDLSCRPCGLHGFANCPKNHFKCANSIEV